MRAIPAVAVDFVAGQEALRLKTYRDSVGVLTVGYGHTGPDVTPALTITPDRAKQLLANDLSTAAARLAAHVAGDVILALTENQYAALLSFVFNIGAGNGWDIWKRLNARQFDQVPLELAKFVNAKIGGQKVKIEGLVNRRNAEIGLWSTAEPGSIPDNPPSSETRAMVTPPTAADPEPLTKKKTFLAACGAAICAAPQAITGAPKVLADVAAAVTPYADKSHYAAHVVELLATASAACAGVAVVLLFLKHRQGT